MLKGFNLFDLRKLHDMGWHFSSLTSSICAFFSKSVHKKCRFLLFIYTEFLRKVFSIEKCFLCHTIKQNEEKHLYFTFSISWILPTAIARSVVVHQAHIQMWINRQTWKNASRITIYLS